LLFLIYFGSFLKLKQTVATLKFPLSDRRVRVTGKDKVVLNLQAKTPSFCSKHGFLQLNALFFYFDNLNASVFTGQV
jgi:hypothetical protein